MCPDREILSVHLDGEIGAPWDAAIDQHLASCPRCRAIHQRIRETHRILTQAATPDWSASMERVRQHILARSVRRPAKSPLWRRRVELPVPLAALGAALLLFLGLTLALLVLRADVGMVKITKAPAGATEYQFTVSMEKVEELLKSMGADDSAGEEIIALPKGVRLIPAHEPLMGKEAEFLRKKP